MGYNVNIERLAVNAVIDIQGNPDTVRAWRDDALPALPETPNTSSTRDAVSLYWIAPERWLLRAPGSLEQDLLSITSPAHAPGDISVVLTSDTLEFFSITGPDTGEVISVATPVDHHPSSFPANGVSYTDVFGVKGLLIRCEGGFEIAVERSFGDMIEDFLARTRR